MPRLHQNINLLLTLIAIFLWSRIHTNDNSGLYVYPCLVGILLLNGILLQLENAHVREIILLRSVLQLVYLGLSIAQFRNLFESHQHDNSFANFIVFATCSGTAAIAPVEEIV